MEFEKLAAQRRYSCRSFEQRPIEASDMVKILEAGRIPDHYIPVAILDMGYPDEKGKQPNSWHWKRKDLNETVVYEAF